MLSINKILLASIFLFCYLNGSGQETTQKRPQKVWVGVIQSSGLRAKEKKNLSLNADYQLVTQGKSYYLESRNDLKDYWGQCVKVMGKVKEGWQHSPSEVNGQYTYERSALFLDSIIRVHCDSIRADSFANLKYTSSCTDTVKGRIERMIRMAPDISYDYKIITNQPIETAFGEETNQSFLPLVSNLDIHVINDLIREGKEVTMCGKMKSEYVETIVFYLDHIIW